jgi:hypothetical protein
MPKMWIFEFARRAGRYLSNCPPAPSGELSARIAHLLWSLEQRELGRGRIAGRSEDLQ